MAMEDYFKDDACRKITQAMDQNEFGNMIVSDAVLGDPFPGLLVDRARGEEAIGSNRGVVSNKYNLFVPSNIAVAKDDKIVYNYIDGRSVYIRITTDAILNDEASGQTGWKTYEAESYTPADGDGE